MTFWVANRRVHMVSNGPMYGVNSNGSTRMVYGTTLFDQTATLITRSDGADQSARSRSQTSSAMKLPTCGGGRATTRSRSALSMHNAAGRSGSAMTPTIANPERETGT